MNPKNPIPDVKNKGAFEILESAVKKYKSDKPLVVGITGSGGAGKTTFGKNIVIYYGSENCVSIDLDDYLIPRETRGKLGITGYHPKANKLFEARSNIIELISRKSILKPCYDHSTGKVLSNETISPREIIVIEGVTPLYPELVELNNISFFLYANEETQIQSRIERDVKERNYSLEEALILYESLKPDYKKLIEPTKQLVDVIFEVGIDYVMHPIHINPKFV